MPLGLLLLVILTKSTGVTHWKLQDGVIKAVVGDPVITDTDREDIPLDDNQVLVYDKELYLLTASKQTTELPLMYFTCRYTSKVNCNFR